MTKGTFRQLIDSPNTMADDVKVPVKVAKADQVRALLTDYDVARNLLQGLKLAALQDGQSREERTPNLSRNYDSANEIIPGGDASNITVSEKMFCSYCEINFKDRAHQKSHYKTDWHRYNLRQRIKGLEPISEDKFEELLVGDISSISGSESSDNSDNEEGEKTKKFALPEPVFNKGGADSSDSDSEMSVHVEGIGRRHPRVFVRNDQGQLLSVYRCVVHSKKNQPEDPSELVSMVTGLPDQTKWVVLMTAAGHFAAAVFDKGVVVAHKTFHRYTVRAKRGTAQGLKDSKGNAPHSAGASLRRYNEAALAQEVCDLLAAWSDHMKSCDRIFLRAPSFNRAMFFGGKTPPLNKKDPRIRLIPFPTRRPTFSELQRVHGVLATIECYGEESTIHDYIQTPPRPPAQTRPKKSSPEKQRSMKKIEEDVDEASNDDSDTVTTLVSSMTTLHTDHLNPFEATKKAKRKKKKKTTTEEDSAPQIVKETSEPCREFTAEEYQIRNDLYTACKVGDVVRLKEILSPLLPADITSTDPDPQGATDPDTQSAGDEAACENADKPVSTEDTQTGSSNQSAAPLTPVPTPEVLNAPFGDSRRTLLHVAVTQNHGEAVTYLLEAGADPSILDWQDKPPYLVATQRPVRNQFRQFMARYPDRYDYVKAQIPPPISSEREAEKKAREAERRKVAKKARKDRLKDKKAEEAEKAAEQKERDRYLNLSDREKRALAAERRLTNQLNSEGKAAPTLSRCWQCGEDITGKVPFEYYDFKFCTVKCLKEHKLSNKPR